MSESSVAKLVEQVESMFDCKGGDHRSHHQVGYALYPYVTLGIIAPASIPEAQECLRQAMYASFFKLKATCRSERPGLYWRYGAVERIQEDVEYKLPIAPLEPAKYKIMTRIAIPEADFSRVDAVIKTEPYTVLRG